MANVNVGMVLSILRLSLIMAISEPTQEAPHVSNAPRAPIHTALIEHGSVCPLVSSMV